MANADMRARLEKRDDDPPRKLAQAERASRYTDQVARFDWPGHFRRVGAKPRPCGPRFSDD